MGTKLIENMDDEIWNRFSGYCKIKEKKVGELLTEVLDNYLKQEGINKSE